MKENLAAEGKEDNEKSNSVGWDNTTLQKFKPHIKIKIEAICLLLSRIQWCTRLELPLT